MPYPSKPVLILCFSPYNDLPGQPILSGASVGACQDACSANIDCAGFVIRAPEFGSTCYLKAAGITGGGDPRPIPGFTTGIVTQGLVTRSAKCADLNLGEGCIDA